jgi:hypothetical protein
MALVDSIRAIILRESTVEAQREMLRALFAGINTAPDRLVFHAIETDVLTGLGSGERSWDEHHVEWFHLACAGGG